MALQLKNYDPAIMSGANIDVAVDLTDITDNNGNEVIEIDGVTSAVNYVRISNAVTGTAAAVSAQGDDSTVGLSILGKGTGNVYVGNSGSAVIAGGSATINAQRGILDTGALTTGTGLTSTVDLINNHITLGGYLMCQIIGGSNTGGLPTIGEAKVGANGSATLTIVNASSAPGGTALNGTLRIAFAVLS